MHQSLRMFFHADAACRKIGYNETKKPVIPPSDTSCLTVVLRSGSIGLVIRSFKDKDTEKVWLREYVKKFGPDVQRQGHMQLSVLDAASQLNTLRIPPGNRLEKLTGDRAGQHSIRINDQWRVCFVWRDGGADNVEITDYH